MWRIDCYMTRMLQGILFRVKGKVEVSSTYKQEEKKVILEVDEKATYKRKEGISITYI